MIRELQSLSMNVIPTEAVIEEKHEEEGEKAEEVKQEAQALEKELGVEEITPEAQREAVEELGEIEEKIG